MSARWNPDLVAEKHLTQLYETRRLRLTSLVKLLADGDGVRFASALGYSSTQIEQFLTKTAHRSRSIGERAARLIEAKASLPFGWLDCADAALPTPTGHEQITKRRSAA